MIRRLANHCFYRVIGMLEAGETVIGTDKILTRPTLSANIPYLLSVDMEVFVEEIKVDSWNQLQDELFSDSWNQDIGRYRSRYAFRGLSDSDYPLATSLKRLGGPYADLEKHLLRNFKKYAHRKVVENDSFWNWLSVAQHYGLPTRLLDWTYSPYVALHFATANINRYDRDGVIWAVNYMETHNLLPDNLKRKLNEEGANVFTIEMLAETICAPDQLNRLAAEEPAIFFEPPSIDDRIVNQFAFFSVLPDPRRDFNEWLQKNPGIWRRIIIPSELKWEIRDKLDQGNITERVLFPGLDGLSFWLSRHYSPRNHQQPDYLRAVSI